MSDSDKIKSVLSTEPFFEKIMNEISALEESISVLPDVFEHLSASQKNLLFHEFERINQNLGTLSSWLSLPISHKTRLKIAPNLKVLISQEEGSITIKLLETKKKD